MNTKSSNRISQECKKTITISFNKKLKLFINISKCCPAKIGLSKEKTWRLSFSKPNFWLNSSKCQKFQIKHLLWTLTTWGKIMKINASITCVFRKKWWSETRLYLKSNFILSTIMTSVSSCFEKQSSIGIERLRLWE